jgi:hypothetical protein
MHSPEDFLPIDIHPDYQILSLRTQLPKMSGIYIDSNIEHYTHAPVFPGMSEKNINLKNHLKTSPKYQHLRIEQELIEGV